MISLTVTPFNFDTENFISPRLENPSLRTFFWRWSQCGARSNSDSNVALADTLALVLALALDSIRKMLRTLWKSQWQPDPDIVDEWTSGNPRAEFRQGPSPERSNFYLSNGQNLSACLLSVERYRLFSRLIFGWNLQRLKVKIAFSHSPQYFVLVTGAVEATFWVRWVESECRGLSRALSQSFKLYDLPPIRRGYCVEHRMSHWKYRWK